MLIKQYISISTASTRPAYTHNVVTIKSYPVELSLWEEMIAILTAPPSTKLQTTQSLKTTDLRPEGTMKSKKLNEEYTGLQLPTKTAMKRNYVS